MLILPRSLLNFGAGWLSALAARRLRRSGRGLRQQRKVFDRLIAHQSGTALGRKDGLEKNLDYETFRSRVPARSYADFRPFIERMAQGEEGLLWPGRCSFFAVSAGTSGEPPKLLPITEAMLAHFRRASLNSLLYYAARVGHTGVFLGKHLFVGGLTPPSPLPGVDPPAYAGELGGIIALNLPRWVEKHLYEPGHEVARIPEWPRKIEAMVERTAGLDIALLAGAPDGMLLFAQTVLARVSARGEGLENLEALWPNLDCFVHGGASIAPFQDDLRHDLGPDVQFHEVFPACEGFIAAQEEAGEGMRLMVDAGLYFEFLPLAKFDRERVEDLGPHLIPLEAVEPGIDYVLFLTTPAGLRRYLLGDIVRFITVDPPRLVHVGRTEMLLNRLGELVVEKEITECLLAVCRRHNWKITNFHVAHLSTDNSGKPRGRHEWWIELKAPCLETPIGTEIARELDAELMARNERYRGQRHNWEIGEPYVRLVAPGVFERWLTETGKWAGGHRMPRSSPDRTIADPLTERTRFH